MAAIAGLPSAARGPLVVIVIAQSIAMGLWASGTAVVPS